MPSFHKRLRIATKGNCDIIDITADVAKVVSVSQLKNGTATVFVPGATGAITTIEYEPGLLQDLKALFEKMVPVRPDYAHNAAWQDDNGHSHLRASLVGPSMSIPFLGGKMTLGTWQQIVLIDFDSRSRDREIVVQVVGD